MVCDRVQQYLDGLPRGLDSYPAFVQKASVFRQFLKLAVGVDSTSLPATLAALVRDPPPVTAWIPEVHATATYLALVELQGWNDQELVARALKLNQDLIRSPLYRVLMFVVSPAMLIRGASDRWTAMHRGITLTTRVDDSVSVRLRLGFPTGLVPRVMAECYATACQAAFEAARAGPVRAAVETFSAEGAVIRCTWT